MHVIYPFWARHNSAAWSLSTPYFHYSPLEAPFCKFMKISLQSLELLPFSLFIIPPHVPLLLLFLLSPPTFFQASPRPRQDKLSSSSSSSPTLSSSFSIFLLRNLPQISCKSHLYMLGSMRVLLLYLIPLLPCCYFRAMVFPQNFHPLFSPCPKYLLFHVHDLSQPFSVISIFFNLQWFMDYHVRRICNVLFQQRHVKAIMNC